MNQLKLNASVRPLLAIMFAVTFCIGFATGKIGADVFTAMAGVVITWWFKTRDEKKKEGLDQ